MIEVTTCADSENRRDVMAASGQIPKAANTAD